MKTCGVVWHIAQHCLNECKSDFAKRHLQRINKKLFCALLGRGGLRRWGYKSVWAVRKTMPRTLHLPFFHVWRLAESEILKRDWETWTSNMSFRTKQRSLPSGAGGRNCHKTGIGQKHHWEKNQGNKETPPLSLWSVVGRSPICDSLVDLKGWVHGL